MITEVKVIADSISEAGQRITTMQLRYPRMIHEHLLTHRVFARNASSSRAIPVNKVVALAVTEIVEPIRWGLNQPGMQASNEELQGEALLEAKTIWYEMADVCARGSTRLGELGLHKQWANRPTEWFSNISVVVTSTEWENFFGLRCHPDAQPEMQELAYAMRDALNVSMVQMLYPGEWHLPYITTEERVAYPLKLLRKISAARCCRVSYLRHDGTPAPIDEDLALCERLLKSVPFHASPFEHQATPDTEHPELHGNLTGWIQYRKMLERKNDSLAVPH